MTLQIIVLGAGAGGGFPQWNSAAPPCLRARAGDPAARACTQTSIAASANGRDWFVINAAPDLRIQIERTPELHPRPGLLRSTPIAGVVLTSGEVDAIAGLLSLREAQAFGLFATSQTHARLDVNPLFEVLARDLVPRIALTLDTSLTLPLADGSNSGLAITPFAVFGKVPLYAEAQSLDPAQTLYGGETIGLVISDGVTRLVFVPACACVAPSLLAHLHDAACAFIDGTLWQDDEMILAGLGTKTGQRMGHMSFSGPQGVMATLAGCRIGQKWLIHLNNSNPLLLADSEERHIAAAAGWQVAYDGLRLTW